jgi:putative ABC transport system permease protein
MNKKDLFSFRLLRAFCPPHLLEEIEGDLMQRYERDLKSSDHPEWSDDYKLRRAKRKLLWNTIRFLRPGILLRNKFSFTHNQLTMFKNYFITSLRHIRKSKVNFAFKLGGLSLAIFSFLAIALYVSYQTTYDTHHHDHQNIYRVNSLRKENGQLEKYAIVPLGIGPLLKQYIPEIEAVARTRYANGSYLRHEGKSVSCGGLIEADSTLFDLLTFNFIEGSSDALRIPSGIVLTRSIAENLFGTTTALGKLITLNNEKRVYQVAAVIDNPSHTCFGFEAVIMNQTETALTLNSILSPVEFIDLSSTLFVRLRGPVTEELNSKIESLLDNYIKKSERQEIGFNLFFQPVSEIYLDPEYKAEFARKGSAVYVSAFSVLAVLLLLMAGINYVNLSIADFSSRARETGVRKVLGARKYQLSTQVALETFLFSCIALALGLGMLYLLFPEITRLLDSDLRFEMLLNPRVVMLAASGLIVLLFLSSFFPAKIFSASGVVQNLKSKNSGYNSSLSKTLLVIQFSISAICISCAVMVGKQISFIHNKELGFDRKNLLMLNMPWEFTVKNMQTFKQEIKRIAGVTHATNSSFMIGGGYWKDWYFVEQEGDQEMKHIELHEVFSDDELFSTLGINLLQGRTFSANIPSDSGAAFIVNESAVRELGWDNPIGKRIYTHPEEKGKWDGTVVGVVSDINISPLYDKVKPLVMRLPWTNEYPDGFIYVRYTGDAKAIIKSIEEKYKTIMPGYPLNWFHVDNLYNRSHEKDTQAFASLQFGTLVIVLISVLGIFSMSMYMSVKRMKEFGIRKVLGASVAQISLLHLNYFVRLVLIACGVTMPIAFFLVREWLTTFAYRVELNYLPFVLVAVASVFVVIVSAGYSAWKSGRMNPVDVIKME